MRFKGLFLVILIGAFLMALFPRLSNAAELRVTDAQGLLRASSDSDNLASVKVTISKIATSQITAVLVNVDGVAPDVSAEEQSDSIYIFRGVNGGTWRVKVEPPTAVVERVEIER